MGEGVFVGQLEAFLEIVRLGNVTRAAESLFLTQPALTSRLKRLEEEVGASLLVRDRRGARLTDAGRAFLPYAERAVATMAEAQRVVGDVAQVLAGELVVAATPKLSTYVLPEVIQRFAACNPTARVSVRSVATEEIVAMLIRGTAQIGFCRALSHPELECVPLYDEEYVLAVDVNHRLARAQRVVAADLASETLITLFRSASYREFIDALLLRSGSRPINTIDIDNPEAGKRMISESVGIGLIPAIAIEDEIADGSLKRLVVEDMPRMSRAMAALLPMSTPGRSPAREFLSLAVIHLRERGLSLDGAARPESSDRVRGESGLAQHRVSVSAESRQRTRRNRTIRKP